MSRVFLHTTPIFEKSFRFAPHRGWTARPFRDVQQTPPGWICPRCGEEQYDWDEMVWTVSGLLCARCAAEEEEQ